MQNLKQLNFSKQKLKKIIYYYICISKNSLHIQYYTTHMKNLISCVFASNVTSYLVSVTYCKIN